MRTFELDYTTGVAPLTVTARLFTLQWSAWRWTLNGAIHKPNDSTPHTFVLPAGTHAISVTGIDRASGLTVQDETVVVTVTRAPFQYGMQTFSELAHERELVTLVENGYTLCRVEAPRELAAAVKPDPPPEGAVTALLDCYARTMQQYSRHGLTCLWVIEPQEAPYVPVFSSVDFMNEMNIGWVGRSWQRMTPAQYRSELLAALPALVLRRATVYAGVASDTDTTAVEWTRQVLIGVPPSVRVSWHRYPNQNRFDRPKKGWKTRALETAGVMRANGGRPFAITEYCYPSQYLQEYCWGLFEVKRTMPQAEQLRVERLECAHWKAQGADAVIRYQIRDGVGDTFGALMLNNQWRKVIAVPMGGRP